MQIEKNSRQVPSIKTICSDKKYYDILYAYLQCISKRNEENLSDTRYINKKEVNFSKMGGIFGVSRQTISTKFKGLIDLGLIEQSQDKYIINVLPQDYAYLIPQSTLQLLTDALSENSISAYVYLFNRYLANKEQIYLFTLDQIKTWVGISTKTRSNDTVVTNILLVLKRIGLIDYELTTVVDESNFQNIKTMYQLDWVKNNISC